MGGLYNLRQNQDVEEKYTIEEERNHMRFYFFSNPEHLMITHFPEEDCYSLIENYKFDYEEFLDTAHVYPKLVIDNLNFITQVKLNDEIDDVYLIKLHAKSHNLNF
jgi:hypothetical protein